MIKCHMKASEVPSVFLTHALNQGFRRYSLLACFKHDGCAVGVISTHVVNLVTGKTHRSDPDIGLDILHEMPEMNRTVGVGQGASNENLSSHSKGIEMGRRVLMTSFISERKHAIDR